jgi:hypothetical protein
VQNPECYPLYYTEDKPSYSQPDALRTSYLSSAHDSAKLLYSIPCHTTSILGGQVSHFFDKHIKPTNQIRFPSPPLPALATHAATTSKDIHIHLKEQFGRNWREYIWNSRPFKANIYGITNRAL